MKNLNLQNLPTPFSYCKEDDPEVKKCPTCGDYEPVDSFAICRVGKFKGLYLCEVCCKQEHEEHATDFGTFLIDTAKDYQLLNS